MNDWDTSAITDFSNLFNTVHTTFNEPIGEWDVSKGRNFVSKDTQCIHSLTFFPKRSQQIVFSIIFYVRVEYFGNAISLIKTSVDGMSQRVPSL
jgi:hypothetical protein